jgi:hypothetical protein
LILIAISGYGKSPVIETLLKPIKKLQAKAYQEYQEKLREYERKLKKEKLDDTEDLPVRPKLKNYLVSDCTVEALANVFENDCRGVISYQDEIAGLILGLNQYKGKGNDRQHYLELFNCGGWKIDRKTGTKNITNTGAAIIGGIQPKVMPKVFDIDSFDDGFIPRFILLNAENIPMVFNRQAITEDDMGYWTDFLEWCYRIPLSQDAEGFVQPKVLILSSSALDCWEQFYNDYGSKMPFLSERARVIIPKLVAYYSLKFAGILHCIRMFTNSLIEENTVAHAISLTHYFAGQAIKSLKLYEQSLTTLNEFHRRLIETLYELKDEIKHDKLALSRIKEAFLSGQSGLQTLEIPNKKIGSMLRDLGLKTEESTGGVYYLVWEPEKIQNIFSIYLSTKSTKSTNGNETTINKTNEVDKVDIMDVSEEKNISTTSTAESGRELQRLSKKTYFKTLEVVE